MNCEEARELIRKVFEEDAKLLFSVEAQLRIHVRECEECRAYHDELAQKFKSKWK